MHPSSSNTRYSARLYNVEGIDQMYMNQFQYREWPTCKVKITEEWLTQVSTSFEQEHKGEW